MGVHYGKADFITYGKPSLFLDFANKKSLVDRISGRNLITFTRTSSGTYVGSDGLIKTASADEPRFDHDPVTGESLGLLIEEERTNSLFPSNLANAVESPGGGITVTTDTTITTPLGDTSGVIKINHTDLSTGYYRRGQNFSLTAGTTYTFSCYFKNETVSNPYNNSGLYLLFQTVSPNYEEVEAQLNQNISMGNGWYKQVLIFTPSYSQTYKVAYSHYSSLTTSLGICYVWGFQLEAGVFPTSYIPTTTAAVTRTADTASITGSNLTSFYNQSAGTVFNRFRNFGYGNAFHAGTGLSFDNSQFQRNMISLNMRRDGTFYRNGALVIFDDVPNYSTTQTSGTSNNINDNVNFYNFAGSFSASKKSFTYNGLTPGTETGVLMPTISRFLLSTNSNYVYDNFCGHISKISYYPFQLTDTQLQALTS